MTLKFIWKGLSCFNTSISVTHVMSRFQFSCDQVVSNKSTFLKFLFLTMAFLYWIIFYYYTKMGLDIFLSKINMKQTNCYLGSAPPPPPSTQGWEG